MSSTWISLCDPDIEDTMTRPEALAVALQELEAREKFYEERRAYLAAGRIHNTRQILERIRDEAEE